MKPSLGWVLLSREALKRAENQLREDAQGVLDEIGFLALHWAYVDRLFPRDLGAAHTAAIYIVCTLDVSGITAPPRAYSY